MPSQLQVQRLMDIVTEIEMGSVAILFQFCSVSSPISVRTFTQLSMLTSFHFYLFQVGVHIADVSHFIRPGNALDQESARRGTTVYLCEKVNGLYLKWNFDTCL